MTQPTQLSERFFRAKEAHPAEVREDAYINLLPGPLRELEKALCALAAPWTRAGDLEWLIWTDLGEVAIRMDRGESLHLHLDCEPDFPPLIGVQAAALREL